VYLTGCWIEVLAIRAIDGMVAAVGIFTVEKTSRLFVVGYVVLILVTSFVRYVSFVIDGGIFDRVDIMGVDLAGIAYFCCVAIIVAALNIPILDIAGFVGNGGERILMVVV
jgi:hypothetical protein